MGIKQLYNSWLLRQPAEKPATLIPVYNIQKLELARNILETRFTDPPTQRELALEVMLNESKLRKGFKEYFATTIYDFITRKRMETAKTLLLEGGRTIYEVTLLTGFKHQANFSIAFKKYFGISLSDLES